MLYHLGLEMPTTQPCDISAEKSHMTFFCGKNLSIGWRGQLSLRITEWWWKSTAKLDQRIIHQSPTIWLNMSTHGSSSHAWWHHRHMSCYSDGVWVLWIGYFQLNTSIYVSYVRFMVRYKMMNDHKQRRNCNGMYIPSPQVQVVLHCSWPHSECHNHNLCNQIINIPWPLT